MSNIHNTWFQEWPTGSEYTNGAGEDVDLVRFTEDPEAEKTHLLAEGFELCGMDYGMDGDTFFAVRKGRLNLIVVWDYLQYIRWVAFSEAAKQFGNLDKVHRIELSKAIVDSDSIAACNIVRTSVFNTEAGTLSRIQRTKLG